MSYLAFLLLFLGIPLLIMTALTIQDMRSRRRLPLQLRSWPTPAVVFVHIIIAVLYTTPWDNYLVATNVWWYDPELVTGILIGWVPIEEYAFFVLQTLLASLWILWLARRLAVQTMAYPQHKGLSIRRIATAASLLAWIAFTILLFSGWQPGTYLSLELSWALVPITLQLAFGADILWHHRRLAVATILPMTIYLSLADTLAIGAGTWTIDPAQSTGILVGHLPLEEFIFFLLTNTLVTFGTILVLAQASQERAPEFLRQTLHRLSMKNTQRSQLHVPRQQF
jgi:lycopene cyclase domain-containing protein